MTRIAPVDPTTAPAAVQSLLEGVHRSLGAIPNLFRVAARSPAALESLVAINGATAKGVFDARTREAIALAVSELNECDYCLSAHSALGKRSGLDDMALAEARFGRSSDGHRAALLTLARAVVEHRGRVGDALERARAAGISDAEVVELVANIALTIFTNYLNQIADTEIDFPVVRHAER